MGHLNYSYNTIKVLPGSGEHNKAYNESKAVLIDNAGLHSFFKMSRQIAPVCEDILGCQILVSNFILKTYWYSIL